jgi:geranylgeranyl pyrophosphate synthase
LARRIVGGDSTEADGTELTALLQGSGAIGRAGALARRHAETAVAQLDAFPDGPARRALARVPDLLIKRDR